MSESSPPKVSGPKSNGKVDHFAPGHVCDDACSSTPAVVASERQQHIVVNASGCVMKPARLQKYLEELFECVVEGYFGSVVFVIRDGQIQEVQKLHSVRVKD